MATEGKMLILVPSNFHLIWAACHRQTGGFKSVIGLSPGYGACPHIPDIPLILHLCCVPAAPTGQGWLWGLCFAGDCNKGVWMTPGHCPEMSSTDLLQFPTVLQPHIWTDLDWPSPHPSTFSTTFSPIQPPCILSVAPSTLEQHRSAHRMSHRRFRINSCLSLDRVASLALSYRLLFIPFLQTTLYPALPFKFVMFTPYLCYVFSKHMPHWNIHTCTTWTPVLH